MRLSATKMGVTNQNRSLGNQLWDLAGGRPSLDLPFADNKSLVDATTGANLVDFTRASSGTYVGSDGLIKTAPVNLLTYSEQFDQWTVASNSVVTPNVAVAPDGTNTADGLFFSMAGATNVSQNATLTQGQQYTFSVYAKAVTPGSNNKFKPYINSTTPKLPPVDFETTSEWQRFSFTFTHTNATASTGIFILNQNDAYITDVYFWGAQLEEGTTATTYIPTTSTLSGAPRFDHDPATGESLGLLIEENRTNELLYSQEFDNAWWLKAHSVITANAATSPAGDTTAEQLTPNADNNTFSIYKSISFTSGNTYTQSIFAKANTYSAIGLEEQTNSGGAKVTSFDLSNGTVGVVNAAHTAGIEDFGNGWYRCSITYSCTETANDFIGIRILETVNTGSSSWTADGTSNLYLWGAQVEAGSFPTSYIPTSGSTVTRAADVAEITGANFANWFNTSEQQGTVFTEVATKGTSGIDAAFAIGSNNDGDRWLQQYFTNSSNAVFYEYEQGSPPAHTYTTGTFIKSAIGRSQGDNAVGLSGSIVQTDSYSGSYSPVFMKIGVSGDANRIFNGHIKRLAYFNTRLPDATLQSITS